MYKKMVKMLVVFTAVALMLSAFSGMAVLAEDASVAAPGENLVLNSGFDNGTNGWVRASESSAMTPTQFNGCIKRDAEHGNYLGFDDTTVAEIGNPGVKLEFHSLKENLMPGTKYLLSFKLNSDWASRNKLYLKFYYGGTETETLRFRGLGVWEELRIPFAVPETYNKESNNNYIYVYFTGLTSKTDESAYMYLDDFEICKMDDHVSFGKARTSTVTNDSTIKSAVTTYKAYDQNVLSVNLFSAAKTAAQIIVGLYKEDGDTKQLVSLYCDPINAASYDDNGYQLRTYDVLASNLPESRTYKAKVFMLDSIGGLEPLAEADAITFEYVKPVEETPAA